MLVDLREELKGFVSKKNRVDGFSCHRLSTALLKNDTIKHPLNSSKAKLCLGSAQSHLPRNFSLPQVLQFQSFSFINVLSASHQPGCFFSRIATKNGQRVIHSSMQVGGLKPFVNRD